MNKIIDTICEIRNIPSIKLSVLNASIKKRIKAYKIKYQHITCPLYFLFFEILIKIKNIKKSAIDS